MIYLTNIFHKYFFSQSSLTNERYYKLSKIVCLGGIEFECHWDVFWFFWNLFEFI